MVRRTVLSRLERGKHNTLYACRSFSGKRGRGICARRTGVRLVDHMRSDRICLRRSVAMRELFVEKSKPQPGPVAGRAPTTVPTSSSLCCPSHLFRAASASLCPSLSAPAGAVALWTPCSLCQAWRAQGTRLSIGAASRLRKAGARGTINTCLAGLNVRVDRVDDAHGLLL